MIDINDSNFLINFAPGEATVGVIGHGYVGKAVEYFFERVCRVLVHDKAKPALKSLEDVVRESELIFVCVPTPMRKDGSCYTGIIEEVLQCIIDTAKRIGRDLNSFIVIVKSTVRPNFTKDMKARHEGLRLLFSPEFLTEANSLQDFVNTNRVIFGGDVDDARIAFKYFEARLSDKVERDAVTILACDPTVAEMVKLYTNGILMTKVLFSNEIHQVCQKLGIEYEEVRVLANLDHRIGVSHTKVPGPDGMLGAGGHCFPKDINNLAAVCRELGVPEKLFTAVIERNDELREVKDWEEMKDRAVTDK